MSIDETADNAKHIDGLMPKGVKWSIVVYDEVLKDPRQITASISLSLRGCIPASVISLWCWHWKIIRDVHLFSLTFLFYFVHFPLLHDHPRLWLYSHSPLEPRVKFLLFFGPLFDSSITSLATSHDESGWFHNLSLFLFGEAFHGWWSVLQRSISLPSLVSVELRNILRNVRICVVRNFWLINIFMIPLLVQGRVKLLLFAHI